MRIEADVAGAARRLRRRATVAEGTGRVVIRPKRSVVEIDDAVVQRGGIRSAASTPSRVAGQGAVIQRSVARPAAGADSRVAAQRTVIQRGGMRSAAAGSRVGAQRAIVQRALARPAAAGSRVATQPAVVQRARARPAALRGRVGAQRAVIQRALVRPTARGSRVAGQCAMFQGAVVRPSAIASKIAARCRVAGQRAVAQRAPGHPAAGLSRVAGYHAVGNQNSRRFAPQASAGLLAGRIPRTPRGPLGQGEPGQAGTVGQIHAPDRAVTVGGSGHPATLNHRELRAVDAPQSHRLVHCHPVSHRAIQGPTAAGVGSIGHQHPRSRHRHCIHGVLDVRSCRRPSRIGRQRIGAVGRNIVHWLGHHMDRHGRAHPVSAIVKRP